MTVLDNLGWTPSGKQWIFIGHSRTHSLTHPLSHPLTHSFTHSLTHPLTGFQWFLFVSQAITRLAINDVPQPVHIQQERQALYVSKVIDKVPDEDLENANSEVMTWTWTLTYTRTLNIHSNTSYH